MNDFTRTEFDQAIIAARETKPWIKFLGIIQIISGALLCLTCYGIVVAWIPIWTGLVLAQSADSFGATTSGGFVRGMAKLRTYFVVTGVMTLISLILVAISFMIVLFTGLFTLDSFRNLR